MGYNRRDKNINHGIKLTAESTPSQFWVYNNGITALVHDFTVDEKSKKIKIHGFSIVNGAQTTGSLGALSRSPSGVRVQARIVKCSSNDTIKSIIRYNNSQNPLASPDFRSNDKVQKRLRSEFSSIPNAEYTGGRRGVDVAQRVNNLLPSDTVAQAIAAAHNYPHVAYHERSQIWLNDNHYSKFFNDETTAEHIVWCYSLLKSIENKKTDLVTREEATNDLPTDEQEALDFMRKRGSMILLAAAISNCIETIMGRSIPNLFKISFGKTVSPAQAEQFWKPIVEITMPFAPLQLSSSLTRGIDSSEYTRNNIKNFVAMVRATAMTNKSILEVFVSRIEVST